MGDRGLLSPLEGAIDAIGRALKDQRIRGMIIGGVAASLLGRPRMTRDVDVVVWLEEPKHWSSFLRKAAKYGLEPRIPNALDFASRTRVLLLRHAESSIDVDVSLGSLPFEAEALSRAKEHSLGKLTVLLPTPEDLIIMKAIAHRPRDAADIEGILDVHPSVDVAHIRHWLASFAEALEAPELLTDAESLLARSRRTRSTTVTKRRSSAKKQSRSFRAKKKKRR